MKRYLVTERRISFERTSDGGNAEYTVHGELDLIVEPSGGFGMIERLPGEISTSHTFGVLAFHDHEESKLEAAVALVNDRLDLMLKAYANANGGN
jgi:hypothetical protein